MKKHVLLILFLFANLAMQAQKGLSFSLSSGISTPTGDFAKFAVPDKTINLFGDRYNGLGFTQQTVGGLQFNLDAVYQFSKLGIGASVGLFNHQINKIDYTLPIPIQIDNGQLSGQYFGVGPQYSIGNGKIKADIMFRAGLMNFKMGNPFSIAYNGEDLGGSSPITFRTVNMENTAITYASGGVKISYGLSKQLQFFTKVDYFTGFGEGLPFQEDYYTPFDINQNKEIDAFDVAHFTVEENLSQEVRYIKPQMINLGAGFSYTFPSTRTIKIGNANNEGIPNPIHATDWNSTRSNKTSKTTRMGNPNNQPRKIVLLSPKDGQHYKDGKMPRTLKWKVVGKAFANPVYIVEMRNMQTKAIKIAKSKEIQIDAHKLFDTDKPSGHYVWRVTEQGSGVGGGPANLFFDNCDFTMSIDNVSIDCKGYEGADRKYEVCFDVSYQSSVGDLTFNNSGSGLFVEDQSNNALNYTLTGSNTSLQTQTGATQSTVHYCFETTVNSSVNSINFGLQGDDLDPGTLTCQPGAGNGVRELPDCLCDECDRITITLDELHVNANQNSNTQYNIVGNINVNVPIYGIEIQVQSYGYSANPSSCSNGVSSIEESGMIVLPPSTINNDANTNIYNENVSNNPYSNNSVSKIIKYMSSTALNGAIPISLTMGLPGALPGLSSNCCKIDYKVCFKIKVYYEDGSCKTCQVIKCINFNNN